MKTLLVLLSFIATSLVHAIDEGSVTALQRFLSAKPPYSIETGKDAYLALCDIRGQRGFVRLGFALGSARLWEEKFLEVSKDGGVDRALAVANYKDTKIYDLFHLGRTWSKDSKTTEKDEETARVFRELTDTKKTGEQAMPPNGP